MSFVDRDRFDLRQNRDSGQLWLLDRQLLWNTVRELRPMIAVETGTWKGGGSTFFITSAMHMNGGGKLFSVEKNEEMFDASIALYSESRMKHLHKHVEFNLGDSCEVYAGLVEYLLRNKLLLDFVFLDGGEDVTAAEFDLLAPMVRRGGVLASHDWCTTKRIDRLAREADEGVWDLKIYGDGKGDFEHGSVGFAKAVRLR